MTEVSDLKMALRFARQGGGAFSFPTVNTASVKEGIGNLRKRLFTSTPTSGPLRFGEINVLGERVRLDYEIFDFRKYKDRVSFKEKYFDNEAPDSAKLENARVVFAKLFANKGSFDVGRPMPPCDANERKLLEEGLENRFESLRLDVLKERNQFGDTVPVREKIDHLQRVGSLLERLDDPTLTCINYAENGQQATPPINLDLEDKERMQRLLRTFAFLVLQGVHKIPGQDIRKDAAAIVKTLEKRIITQEEMAAYAEAFNAAGKKLPSIITDVLTTTETQPGLLAKMVAAEHKALYEEILKRVRARTEDVYKGSFQTDFDLLVTRYENEKEDYRNRIVGVFVFILDKYQGTVKELETKIAEHVACEERREETANALADCHAAQEGLRLENDRLRAQIQEQIAKIAAESQEDADHLAQIAALRAQLDAANTQCAASMEPLRQQIENLTAENGTAVAAAAAAAALVEQIQADLAGKNELINELQGDLGEANAKAAELQIRVNGLEAQLAEKNEEAARLQETIRNLQKEIERLRAENQGLESATIELNAAVAANTERIRVLESGASGAQIDSATLAAEIARLKKENSALEEQISNCREEAREINEKKNKITEEYNALNAELEQCINEKLNIEEQMAALTERTDATVASADQRVTDAEAAKGRAEQEKADLEDVIAGLRAQIEANAAALAAAVEDTRQKEDELAAHKGNIAGLNANIAAIQAEKDALGESQDANTEQIKLEYDGRIHALEQELETGERHRRYLAGQLTAAKKAADEAAAALKESQRAAAAAATAAAATAAAAQGELEQKAAEASGAAAAQVTASESKYKKLLGQLKTISDSISRGDKTLPEGTLEEANPAFTAIFSRISALSEIADKAKDGESSLADKTVANRLYCLLAYYTNIYLHMFFYNPQNLGKGKVAFDFLSGMIGPKIIGAGELPGEPNTILDLADKTTKLPFKDKPDMDKIYLLLDALIPYIQGVESFLFDPIEKERGYYQLTFPSLANIAFAEKSKIFNVIYKILKKNKEGLISIVSPLFEKTVDRRLLGRSSSGIVPILYITDFGTTPGILYEPRENKFMDMDEQKRMKQYNTDTNSVGELPLDVAPTGQLEGLQTSKFLLYEHLLGLFVVLCQKYIVAKQGSFESFCPVPKALLEPEKAFNNIAASRIQQAYAGHAQARPYSDTPAPGAPAVPLAPPTTTTFQIPQPTASPVSEWEEILPNGIYSSGTQTGLPEKLKNIIRSAPGDKAAIKRVLQDIVNWKKQNPSMDYTPGNLNTIYRIAYSYLFKLPTLFEYP